jgi:hypothetical protein
MLYVTEEGGNLKLGINFYPWSDNASFGFRIRTKNTAYWFRWSKVRKRFKYERIRIYE